MSVALTAPLKAWFWPLFFMASVVFLIVVIVWPSPSPDASKISIVAICRDGTRIYQRADGSHYARAGFERLPVPNPETVCK